MTSEQIRKPGRAGERGAGEQAESARRYIIAAEEFNSDSFVVSRSGNPGKS